MKRIDRVALGPSAPYLWRETRKRRYKPILSPPRIAYLMVPHFHLSGQDRIRIVQEEEAEGMEVWSEMSTTINGLPTKVLASRKWAVIKLGDQQYLPLEVYPLVDIAGIQLGPPAQPVYEDRTINARYRCKHASETKLSFEPVERQYQFPDGGTTELIDFTVNLSDEIRNGMGAVNEGDIKDFALNVRVLAGFEVPTSAGCEAEDLLIT
jgi:hypothetical protein